MLNQLSDASEIGIPFEIQVTATAHCPNFSDPALKETVKYAWKSLVVPHIEHFKCIDATLSGIGIKLRVSLERNSRVPCDRIVLGLDEVVKMNSHSAIKNVRLIRGDIAITHYAESELLRMLLANCRQSGSLVSEITLQ